jgi:hypothetical protein
MADDIPGLGDLPEPLRAKAEDAIAKARACDDIVSSARAHHGAEAGEAASRALRIAAQLLLVYKAGKLLDSDSDAPKEFIELVQRGLSGAVSDIISIAIAPQMSRVPKGELAAVTALVETVVNRAIRDGLNTDCLMIQRFDD